MFAEPRFKRINISAGPQKSYRLPLEAQHQADDTLTWWCLGEQAAIEDLLGTHIGYLGKKRSVGLGRVMKWTVEPCEPWGPEFPVVRDGRALRPLPIDWPGLDPETPQAYRTLTYPYWRHGHEELCAVP